MLRHLGCSCRELHDYMPPVSAGLTLVAVVDNSGIVITASVAVHKSVFGPSRHAAPRSLLGAKRKLNSRENRLTRSSLTHSGHSKLAVTAPCYTAFTIRQNPSTISFGSNARRSARSQPPTSVRARSAVMTGQIGSAGPLMARALPIPRPVEARRWSKSRLGSITWSTIGKTRSGARDLSSWPNITH